MPRANLDDVLDKLNGDALEGAEYHTTDKGKDRLEVRAPEQVFYVVPRPEYGFFVYHPYQVPFPKVQQKAALNTPTQVAEYIESHWDKVPE